MVTAAVILVARVALLVSFAIALTGKVRSRQAFSDFARSLQDVRVVPQSMTSSLAATIVALEVLCVISLTLSKYETIGLSASVLTLALLSLGVLLVVRSGDAVSCHCFGAGGSVLTTRHLVRNVLMLLVAIAALLLTISSEGHGDSPEILFAGALGLLIGVLVTRWDDLAFLVAGET